MPKKKDYRFEWEKTKAEWASPDQRDNYFHDLHMRVITVQADVMQELLDEDLELQKKFMERWQHLDSYGFILAGDPEYNLWLEEKRGEDEEE